MKLIRVGSAVMAGGFLGMLLARQVPLSEKEQTMKCDARGYRVIESVADAVASYPKTAQELKERSEKAQKQATVTLNRIISLKPEEYSRETVLQAFDILKSVFTSELAIFSLLKSVHPDPKMLEEAEKQVIALNKFAIEHIESNEGLFKVFKAYAEGVAKTENLSSDDRYFLHQVLEAFELQGLNLPEDKRVQVLALKQRCAELESEFHRWIDQDMTTVCVTQEGMAGVPEDFKNHAKRDGELYVLSLDYPTRSAIMSYCAVEETRKKYSKAFANKGYPQNEAVLAEIIQKRHEYAALLGFESYAAYDLVLQMIKTPERAAEFEHDLQKRALIAADKDFKQLTSDLPEGVSLTSDGKLNPWDSGFVTNYFKKKYYSIDEQEFAEYFPMEKTVAGLIHIYEQFFDVHIKTVSVTGMWHEDVRLLEVKRKADKVLLGYIFLDMFPRPNKYGHAAAFEGVAGFKKDDGTRTAATVTVVCNFTKPTPEKPSLLKYGEVNTFFHEFGHAIHMLFGVTKYVCLSGFNTEIDFVELPSQMLENWLEDKEILTLISSHYKTGKPLPEELINKRLELLKFGQGLQVTGQLGYGMVSLELFGPSLTETPGQIYQRQMEANSRNFAYDTDTHNYCSFGHLMGYGAKYYGYLWSLVLAEDVFEQIKKEGLLNPQAGKKYVDAILSQGGGKDANDMIRDYLGREPQFDAFYRKMGF